MESKNTVSKTIDKKEATRLLKLVADGYNNLFARLGNNEQNSMSSSYYMPSRLTSKWQEITTMYREGWLTKKIIDMPAEDMTKAWISFDTQISQDSVRKIEREMRTYRVQKKFTDAIKWGRLYGGAVAVILIDGEEDMMDRPLDLTLVMPGTFRGLLVLDRWNGVTPSSDLVDDLADPDYGMPVYYDIQGRGDYIKPIRVHHSRVLRFIGRELPYSEEESEMFWGASEIEHIFDEINKRNATSSNIAQLVFQANLRVLKMGDLGQLLAMSDERTQQELYRTVQAQNMLMTSFGLQVIDNQDSFETHPYSFSGLNDIYQSFMSDIAGAAEIPATKLFGKSPDGMNATGDGDLTNYYESINQKQENTMRPALEKLMPVVCVSALGVVPDDLEIVFEPTESATAQQKAQVASQISAAINTLYVSDIISKAIAMKELRKSSFVTGIGSTITDADIKKAEKEASMPSEIDFNGKHEDLFTQQKGSLKPPENEPKQHAEDAKDDSYALSGLTFDWDEEQHPRDEDGKFTSGSGGSANKASKSEESQPPKTITKKESAPKSGSSNASKTARGRTSFPIKSKPIQQAKTVGEMYTQPIELTKEEQRQLDNEVEKVKDGASDAQEKYEQQKRYWGSFSEEGYRQEKIRQIPADLDADCKQVYLKAVEAEKEITSDLKKIKAEMGGDVQFDGLEFRLKDAKSFAGKIERKMQNDEQRNKKFGSLEIAESFNDLNRYTFVSPSKSIAKNAKTTLDRLKAAGYNIKGVKNTWKIPDASYRGINVKLDTPNGQRFELQFHTPEDLKIKAINHLEYEVQRVKEESDPIYSIADKKMKQRLYDLSIPKDIWEVGD